MTTSQGQSFHRNIISLINRLYPRKGQHTAREILKGYFTQSPDRRRRLTLDALGKLKTLEKEVTRERARQIIAKFKDEVLAKEFQLLKRGLELNDEITINKRSDLHSLLTVIQEICTCVETYELPIFADRIHKDLEDQGLIDSAIYFPIVAELAQSVSIETNFTIYNYDGNRIILKKGANTNHFTSELIKHAGKIATHMGGVFPINNLFDEESHRGLPKQLKYLNNEVNTQYKIDLLRTQDDLILLQDSEYFAFVNRDERISSILLPIFKAYDTDLPKDRLLKSISTSLTQRFMSKPNNSLRDNELNIIKNSSEAIDEYCIRTLLLEPISDSMRAPGKQITDKMADYEPGELYEAQIQVVNEIKQYGKPLPSMTFGKIFREKLKLKDSFKVTLYTYPALYYKEGEGRRNDFYKTLDGKYEIRSDHKAIKQKVKSLTERKIKALQKEINDIEFDNLTIGQVRIEQGLIRKFLIETSQREDEEQKSSCKCMICNRYFPIELLVAAHVKKRSHCSNREKSDIKNIAMLQCSSCDKLFEHGYIFVSCNGTIEINSHAPTTNDLNKEVMKLAGNKCEYFDGTKARESYIKFHRELSIKRFQES